MGEYWDQDTRKWRDEETGRTVDEQRDFQRGYESVQTGSQMSMPTASFPEPEPRQFTLAGPRATAKGDRGTWQRTTVAGALALAVAPDDPAAEPLERRAALAWIDQYEFTYGRRPTMEEARLAVRRSADSPEAVRRRVHDGTALGGTAQEIGEAFRAAGLRFAVVSEILPLAPPEAVTQQPVIQG